MSRKQIAVIQLEPVVFVFEVVVVGIRIVSKVIFGVEGSEDVSSVTTVGVIRQR